MNLNFFYILNLMETINPKNFIDIDPSSVSFITLKDGNMIMLDDSTPVKPSKEKKIQSSLEEINTLDKVKPQQFLAVSFPTNFSYKGSAKKKVILKITKNINFSYNKTVYKNKEKNIPSPNSSIDFKSSMLQSKKDMTNLNINNSTNINKNIFSEDNVNIRMTDTLVSKQTTINANNENENKNEDVMPSNNISIFNDNKSRKKVDKKSDENVQAFTFKNEQKQLLDINKEINLDLKEENNDDKNNNNEELIEEKENKLKNKSIEEKIDTFKKIVFNNNKIPSSLIINNNNFSSKISENPKRSIKTEVSLNEEKTDTNKTYNKINKRLPKEKNTNYIKAVISINIPGEEKKNPNIVTQFNSLVDRLNGQKSKGKIKNIKKSDRFYELYKNSKENYILHRILSPKKTKRKIPHDYFRDISSFLTNSEMSTIASGKGSSLNSRIMALKEKTNPNNSFRSDNENNPNDKNNDIVLPSNFLYSK